MEKDKPTILLIDDDSPTNYFHELLIQRSGFDLNVVAVTSGAEALEYLNGSREGNYPPPKIIILDINMPGIDGWEFLEHYEKLPNSALGEEVVVMVSSSINPDNNLKFRNSKYIKLFQQKPLTKDIFKNILEEFLSY